MKFYLISDSHSRTFAYNAIFVPLFIGPGKSNLMITKQQYNDTKNKICDIVNLLEKSVPIIFVLNEANIRFYLQSFSKDYTNESEFVKELVKKQIEILEIFVNQNRKVFITTAIPREDKQYARLSIKYNDELRNRIENSKIKLIDFLDKASKNDGTIKTEFKADFIHANYKLGNLLANVLNEQFCLYEWSYKYDFSTFYDHKFQIWGDFPKEGLIYDASCPRDWTKLNKLTNATYQFMKILNFVHSRFEFMKTVFIMNSKEGYIPFKLEDKSIQCYCYENNTIAKKLFSMINFFKQNIIYKDQYQKCDVSIITEKLYNNEILLKNFQSNQMDVIIIENNRLKAFLETFNGKNIKIIKLDLDFCALLSQGRCINRLSFFKFFIVMYLYNMYYKYFYR